MLCICFFEIVFVGEIDVKPRQDETNLSVLNMR